VLNNRYTALCRGCKRWHTDVSIAVNDGRANGIEKITHVEEISNRRASESAGWNNYVRTCLSESVAKYPGQSHHRTRSKGLRVDLSNSFTKGLFAAGKGGCVGDEQDPDAIIRRKRLDGRSLRFEFGLAALPPAQSIEC
jgi:hypothetical protein